MSVIIRLQNLPWSANALDIRQYFHGLSIPEGGVHIVGGEQGDAFIAFSTDEDARQAMMADGGKIKEVKLKLLLSSRAEMQKVIETARQQTLALQNFMQIPAQQATPPLPTAPVPAAPHMLGVPAAAAAAVASGVLSHLHMQHSAGGHPQHMLAPGNVPHHQQSLPPQQQSHIPPPMPPLPPQAQQTNVPSSTPATEKKDGERTRGDRRRSRSRSRDNSRRRSKDKDRDRYRRRSNRSRSRSRDRRRKDRSRDRSRSRDRTRDRRGRSDKDSSKDNKDKDKQNGASDVVVVGQFPARSNNKNSVTPPSNRSEARRPPQQNLPQQPAMINGNMAKPGGAAPVGGWNNPQPPADVVAPPERPGPNNVLLPNPNAMTVPMRMPVNFPPSSDMRGFPFPGAQDQQGWIPPRQPGIPPQQQAPPRFEDGPQGRGGFRGPPSRPRPTRFESTDGLGGPPEYDDVRGGGPFPPPARGRDRPVYDDDFRGGPRPPPPFRDGARMPRQVPHTCVEVRNVPGSAAYRDIREFFQSMHVLNIKLLNDDEGRKTGVAYIKFVSLENKEAALTMNGMMIHGSAVEILHVDDNIYEEALDCHQPNAEAVIVALHGLPHYANEQDIRRLFPGARLLNIVMSRSSNPHSPQAFIQFSTLQEGRRALGASGKLTVDGKDIFVERSNLETLMNTKKMMAEMVGEPHVEVPKPEEKLVPKRQEPVKPAPTDCVLLQGLPGSSNDREILDFFSDVGLVPLRIHVMLDSNNTPSGDAFCEFSNCTEGARALAKNANIMGTKEISVRSVVRAEMEQALGILEQKHNEEQSLPPRPMPGARNGPIPPEHMRGGHMGGPMRGHGHMHPGEFMGRGGRYFGEMRGGPHMRGHRGMHHGGPPMMGRGHAHGHPPHPPHPPPPPPPSHMPPHPDGPTVDKFGNPGCVIELQNVPYKADIDEIIEYFEGFDVARANVIRRYSDGGMPTGDARVALRAPAEAQRALQTLKFKKMRERPIYLSIV